MTRLTVQDIIGRAAREMPDAFRASLISQAEMHDDYMQLSRHPRSKQGAESQRDACLAIYDAIGLGNLAPIYGSMSQCVIALNVAAKLIGATPAQRTAAIVDWDEACSV